jgi:polysaccharide biosynthesis/export protein
MSAGSSSAVLRDIQTLFDSGTASGLSDRQLLERFARGSGASAESAFEVLVLRHGPMVMQVCRNSLGNATDAQDAFQATFLVLVRRWSSIRRLESVGGWLYGVAFRVAARARVDAARRRAVERRGALRLVEALDTNETDGCQAESNPALQAEVERLPERYRAVVVLCYWEGLTQEQAALQLGCPIGTVRSRLARARDILRRRLVRRGLAPLAGVVAGALGASSVSGSSSALGLCSVPGELVRSTAVAAANIATGEALRRVASGQVSSLVRRVLWRQTMVKTGRLLAACLFAGLGVLGASVWAQRLGQERSRPRTAVQADRGFQRKPKTAIQKVFPAHVVEPPDLIIVEVLEALPGRPISGERLVRPDGTITLGFYGDVKVAGLTLPEIKEKIIRQLQKFITDEALGIAETDPDTGEPAIDPATGKPKMLDPKDSDAVFVDVTAYNSANYYVEGEVQQPGLFPCTGNQTVLDVIHNAEGLLPSADRSKVKLVRNYPKGSPVQVLPVDYEEITMGTDATTNYMILPQDRLVIPRDPNYVALNSASRRSGQRRLQADGESRPSAKSRSDAVEKPSASVRAFERRLNAVEKKLDKIIEWMEQVKNKAEE